MQSDERIIKQENLDIKKLCVTPCVIRETPCNFPKLRENLLKL